MRSIYIGQLLRPAAAPLIVRMHVHLGGLAIICNYLHPAVCMSEEFQVALLILFRPKSGAYLTPAEFNNLNLKQINLARVCC